MRLHFASITGGAAFDSVNRRVVFVMLMGGWGRMVGRHVTATFAWAHLIPMLPATLTPPPPHRHAHKLPDVCSALMILLPAAVV